MIRVEARRGIARLDLGDVLDHLELLTFFVWRDLKVRYKQATLGVAWVALQPLLMMILFSIFFGKLVHVPSDGLPYPVFLYAGLLPWTLFSTGLTNASQSLVSSAHLITKVYFPRIVIPLAAATAAVVDFLIAFLVLVVLMVVYAVRPGTVVVWLPAFILLVLITSLAASLWLGALNVRYRDVQATLPFIVQFWFFATPVVYPSTLVKGSWRAVFALNPMAGAIDGFRWALLRDPPPSALPLVISTAVALLALLGGIVFFRSLERSFADWV